MSINHNVSDAQDRIAYIGELEHTYRHLVKAFAKTRNYKYHQWAVAVKVMRRNAMKELEIGETDWCIAKSLAAARQLAYETDKPFQIQAIDGLVNEVYSDILGMELVDCCDEDREADNDSAN